jgi:hypothetical protein
MTAANLLGTQSTEGYDENFDFNVPGIKTLSKGGSTVEGNWMVATSTKHWIGYSVPDSGADRQRATARFTFPPSWLSPLR